MKIVMVNDCAHVGETLIKYLPVLLSFSLSFLGGLLGIFPALLVQLVLLFLLFAYLLTLPAH